MGNLIMILGKSGSGKSTSLRNFKPDEVGVFSVAGKRLPFRSELPIVQHAQYARIAEILAANKRRCYVVDDATYLMTDEFMRTAKTPGYQKFTDMAKNFYDTVELARSLPDDKIVYFIGHSDQADDGREHFKTIGKMLDNYVTVEGKFTIVLKTVVKDGEYYFSTQNNGQDTVKTPMEMFDQKLIPNDLHMVDETIRKYYEMEDTKHE